MSYLSFSSRVGLFSTHMLPLPDLLVHLTDSITPGLSISFQEHQQSVGAWVVLGWVGAFKAARSLGRGVRDCVPHDLNKMNREADGPKGPHPQHHPPTPLRTRRAEASYARIYSGMPG